MCTVALKDADAALKPGASEVSLRIPRVCTPDNYCSQLDEAEDADISYLQILLIPVLAVLMALDRFLVLRLFLRPLPLLPSRSRCL